MKLPLRQLVEAAADVAPHAGAWIEIKHKPHVARGQIVAPHAGAWIEMSGSALERPYRNWSHPTRVRGLKSRR